MVQELQVMTNQEPRINKASINLDSSDQHQVVQIVLTIICAETVMEVMTKRTVTRRILICKISFREMKIQL